MKSLIIGLLGSALLLSSCTSFMPLEAEDRAQGRPKPDESIRVTLVDGSVIEADASVNVSEPSDFVFGVGEMYMMQHLREPLRGISFVGKLPYSLIDSARIVTRGSNRVLVCWISPQRWKNSDSADCKAFLARPGAWFMTRIEFEKGDYFRVSGDTGVGLWCAGTLLSNREFSNFAGRIPFERIKEIEVRKDSPAKTALLIIGVSAIVLSAFVVARMRGLPW
jgi:hypothetical protein